MLPNSISYYLQESSLDLKIFLVTFSNDQKLLLQKIIWSHLDEDEFSTHIYIDIYDLV